MQTHNNDPFKTFETSINLASKQLVLSLKRLPESFVSPKSKILFINLRRKKNKSL